MREALRLGQSHGRVVIDDVLEEHTFGLGALANLEGEITILNGITYIAEANSGELILRPHTPEDEATLLITANVETWDLFPISGIGSYQELEEAVAVLCKENGLDVSQPTPFWVQGAASDLELHVINGSCPIANPSGPAPLRIQEDQTPLQLFGIYVEDAAGEFTHHNRVSHVHAIAHGKKISGHVDAIAFNSVASIWIPATP
ncbi:MAG: hypothetical protein GY747_02695 [Planctomycetes bacterium]|nr:hypothetical protein [Planctomycetota bacterium]MCP4770191.1 hypothetical protein [Planctomycetota bacterium]MCP4860661.1 hypothetical protein [Planctomycetota bacterium]